MPDEANVACLQLPPSQLLITVRLEAAGAPLPIRYRFVPSWYRAADSAVEFDTTVTLDARTFVAALAGGRYFYSIANEGEPLDAGSTGSTGQGPTHRRAP